MYPRDKNAEPLKGKIHELMAQIPSTIKLRSAINGQIQYAGEWQEIYEHKQDESVCFLSVAAYNYGKDLKYRIWCDAGGLFGEVKQSP